MTATVHVGKVPAAGSLFTNPTMAATYARILREAQSAGADRERQIEKARACWSQGFVAEAIDTFCRTNEVMDTSGRRHRGVLSAHDLATWQATVEAPISYDYGRYTVLKAGPWPQGLVTLPKQPDAGRTGFSSRRPAPRSTARRGAVIDRPPDGWDSAGPALPQARPRWVSIVDS